MNAYGTLRLTTIAELNGGFVGTLARDLLWKDPPPLADGCEHDFRLLPVIEFRMTVLCRKCDGLDTDLSRELAQHPEGFRIGAENRVSRREIP